MSSSIKEIEQAALHLSVTDRAHLALLLLESLDQVTEEESTQLWLTEAQRRVNDIDQGMVQLVTGDELESQVQSLFK